MTNQIARRARRAKRVGFAISQNTTLCRLSVYRSNENIYAQIIDDQKQITLAQASTLDREFKARKFEGTGREQAAEIGKLLAERAISAGVTKVVFCRGAYQYHGRIKAIADGARSGGLIF